MSTLDKLNLSDSTTCYERFREYFFMQISAFNEKDQTFLGYIVEGDKATENAVEVGYDLEYTPQNRPDFKAHRRENSMTYLKQGDVIFVQNATMKDGIHRCSWLNKASNDISKINVLKVRAKLFEPKTKEGYGDYQQCVYIHNEPKLTVNSTEDFEGVMLHAVNYQYQNKKLNQAGIVFQLHDKRDHTVKSLSFKFKAHRDILEGQVDDVAFSVMDSDKFLSFVNHIEDSNLLSDPGIEITAAICTFEFIAKEEVRRHGYTTGLYQVASNLYWRESYLFFKEVKSTHNGEMFWSLQTICPTGYTTPLLPNGHFEDKSNLTLNALVAN